MRVRAVSENAVLIEFGQQIDEALIPVIAAAMNTLRKQLASVVIDFIPSYTTLLCIYDHNQVDSSWMVDSVQRLVDTLASDAGVVTSGKLVEIPVWYDPCVGYDLEALADSKAMTIRDLIELHTGREYQVFAIGFSPGFAFLGRLDERIATPRHNTPRKSVARGSVGIADAQTAVYPLASPGGWNIIGRTPQAMFDASVTDRQASLLSVGDRVRFVPIDQAEFRAQGGQPDD
ncbi:5-oxoprolinase subunit PxpB [Saccharospirillum impatiens]|uniref:5-oxoprolinase subunit PxpB n=1 Tax=Saccharospirillum impatiens TaxID=169438 RepID=UPI00041DF36C|nr:5-oxoprolinase subunit PxpB [Saccharospirillum impatiens]